MGERCGEKTNWSSASDFDDDTAEDADELEYVRRWDFMSPDSPSRGGFNVAERLRPGGMEAIISNAQSGRTLRDRVALG